MVLWVAGFVSALNTAAVPLLFSALAQTVSVAANMVGTRSKLSSFFFTGVPPLLGQISP